MRSVSRPKFSPENPAVDPAMYQEPVAGLNTEISVLWSPSKSKRALATGVGVAVGLGVGVAVGVAVGVFVGVDVGVGVPTAPGSAKVQSVTA